MPFILSVDYDNTLFEGSYPDKGKPKTDVINKVKEFEKHNAEIVLWTCREGKTLDEAVKRCKQEGLVFDAVNSNAPSQLKYMAKRRKEGEIFATRKIYADFYLDDKAYNIDYFMKIKVEKTCRNFVHR